MKNPRNGAVNEANVFYAREGYYKGKKVVATHRDPQSGELWLEDYPVGKSPVTYGVWVPADSVRFVEGQQIVRWHAAYNSMLI